MRLFYFKILITSTLFAIWLTRDQAALDSPFEVASLGWKIDFPSEGSYVFRGNGDDWRSWFKVNLASGDTTLFLDSLAFRYNGDDLHIDNLFISNNGERILIKTNSKQIWRYSSKGTYYFYDRILKRLNPLTLDNFNLRNVKFSPDGKKIAYVRDDNNLYCYDIHRKREKKLTNSGSETVSNGHFGWLYEEELTGYDGYRWSPDSEEIAFWEEDESKVPEYSIIDELGLYPIIKQIRYPKVGQINPSLRIGIVRVKGAGKRWIRDAITEDNYLPWMEWIGNKKLSFLKMNRKQNHWDLFVADKNTGKSTLVLSEDDPGGWLDNDGEIYFLKDGKIIWISEQSGFKHIWISKHSGTKKRAITKGDWEVSKIKYIDEETQKIYFTANQKSTFDQNLFAIRFDGTEMRILTPESGVHRIEITNDKKYFIDYYSSLMTPPQIILKELTTGKILRIIKKTDISQYTDYEWSTPKIIHFPSKDGEIQLDGILIYPPNFDTNKQYPVIIHGYGMPGTQIVWNKWGKVWDQFLAQQGYIVFSMDTRGMSGRGEKFKNYSYGDMAKYLAKDQISGIEFLTKKKYIDRKRIGAWGWSGGGYFTCLMLTKNGDYFKAGVAIAPCTDFKLYDTAYTERSMGLLTENKNGYDSTNTLSWLHKMKGKLLIMHGSDDDNVHAQHTTHFVNKALRNGKDVVWHKYPGRNHGIYGGGARKDLYTKMIRFFNQNL